MEIGYWLVSEEHGPHELVEHAKLAERAGFEHLLVSDHVHPWVDAQGHSPFVWGVIGAIAEATERIRLGTAVTCPLVRMHPAIVAHAAATAQILMDGRFFLGLGTGENLNEHVLGDRRHLPGGRRHRPDPRQGRRSVAPTEDEARELALTRQPNPAIPGDASTELSLPREFGALAQLVRPEHLEESLVLGDDPGRWREKIDEYRDAGFTHVALHHVGVEQDDFIEFAAQFI